MTKRKRRNYFLGATAVVTFALTTFFVIPGAANRAFADDNVNGTTQVQVGVAMETMDTVSYDVPLYYVLCVVNDTDAGDTKVVLPKENAYYIKNISKQKNVAVTGLSVSSVKNAEWSLTDQIDHSNTNNKVIHITVGGINLPTLKAGASDSQNAEIVPKTGQPDNTFYGAGGYHLIEKDTSLVIPVTAEVSKKYQVTTGVEGKAAAQFLLKYQVSPMDEAGNILKADYNGPAPTP